MFKFNNKNKPEIKLVNETKPNTVVKKEVLVEQQIIETPILSVVKELPKFKYTYETEMQIVCRDRNVHLHHFKKSFYLTEETFNADYIDLDAAKTYVMQGFSAGVLSTKDKANEFIYMINTDDISKILYKPCSLKKELIK